MDAHLNRVPGPGLRRGVRYGGGGPASTGEAMANEGHGSAGEGEVTTNAADQVATAQDALDRWAWAEAFERAGSFGPVPGVAEADRLDILADAAWWLGRLDDCIEARELAYARYESAGDARRAGQCAVWLYEHHHMKARPAIGGAWLRRARRALDAERSTVEFGQLILREAEVAHGAGELDRAAELGGDALVLARQLRSVDLEAEALQTIGRVLIDAGRPADGLGHLDEAMLSAVEGRLRPYTTGKVYCSLISACEELGDLRRAAEWTDATMRWSERHPFAMWPGICRVHHASLLQLRGDWGAAEQEARRACVELDGFHLPNAAAGYVEIGDIRRRLGDLDGAEEAFSRAEELCGHRSAGLALLRLAQGQVDAATAIITGMLAEQTWNRLARGKLLPARVQIAVAAGDLAAAETAAGELDRIAAGADNPTITASAAATRGRLQLAQDDSGVACATLQHALHLWQQLDVPYEIATVRLLLGQACRRCGDEDGATRSLARAAAIFDQLGAAHDAGHRADVRTPGSAPEARPDARPAGLTEREVEVLQHVASGRTNRDIAEVLHLSERTVARHLSNIFTKIGVSSRTGATAFAYEHDLR